jgi:hypothetical protein
MPDLSALLAGIPDRYKPWTAVVIGAFLLVVLVLLHGAGLHAILVLHGRRVQRLRVAQPKVIRAVVLFGTAVFLMLSLHMVGCAIWAYTLLYLGLVPQASDAIYFSANAYTTLGFGNVDLGAHWRNISPIIGISGLFTFAWTTSALVTVVTAHSKLIQLLERKRTRQIHMRFALHKTEWAALQSERSAERSERDAARAHAGGASLSEWIKIWTDEKKRVKALRAATRAKIEDLRHQECEDEKKIEPELPPVSPGSGSL